jgi:hypothetical protein
VTTLLAYAIGYVSMPASVAERRLLSDVLTTLRLRRIGDESSVET